MTATPALGVLSSTYPAVQPFVADWLASLTAQTDLDFTLIVANDGLGGIKKFLIDLPFPVQVADAVGTPVSVRKTLIRTALDRGLDLGVFLDADDMAAPNRVAVSRAVLSESDIVFNELREFSETSARPDAGLLAPRFAEGMHLTSAAALRDGNVLGLSNTAARLTALKAVYEQVPDDIVAYDWALYAAALMQGCVATFTAKTETLYRRHEHSLARLDGVSPQFAKTGVGVKAGQYRFLATLDPTYEDLAQSYEDLRKQLDQSPDYLKAYALAAERRAPAHPLWWEMIRLPEELN